MDNYATGIQHIGIPTKDIKATKSFFEKLGFTAAFETVEGRARVIFLKMGNLVIETYEGDAKMADGAIDHVAIDVADVDRVYKEICDMGLNTLRDEIHFLPFWERGVRFFTIKGPNEERIEFSQFM
jgi:catechol 2,3-dioxygenase-like lactoylglutathione lyase family enzyme